MHRICLMPSNGDGMLRAALGTTFLSAVKNLNRNCKPFKLCIFAAWNIPYVTASCFYFLPVLIFAVAIYILAVHYCKLAVHCYKLSVRCCNVAVYSYKLSVRYYKLSVDSSRLSVCYCNFSVWIFKLSVDCYKKAVAYFTTAFCLLVLWLDYFKTEFRDLFVLGTGCAKYWLNVGFGVECNIY